MPPELLHVAQALAVALAGMVFGMLFVRFRQALSEPTAPEPIARRPLKVEDLLARLYGLSLSEQGTSPIAVYVDTDDGPRPVLNFHTARYQGGPAVFLELGE